MSNFFPQEWIEEVRLKNDIVDVISEFVQLKPSGRNFVGLCPFHNEKTASFNVNAEKQFYYCFGCHAGGNVIHFIMNIERMSFTESIKLLAERAHISLPDDINDEAYLKERDKKERLYLVGKTAAHYFHKLLFTDAGKIGLNYLQKRGIKDTTIKRFGLGYAEERWDGLLHYLLSKEFTEEEVVAAGLAIDKDNRKYDRFRNRVIFPIINVYGRVIGFGGRVLDDTLPKYLNSPETIIFNKRENLYGLNNIKKKHMVDNIFMVEGYMDVISLYQSGYENTVASLGTSLTQEQAGLLKRYANTVYIAYDGDAAGQKATIRGLDILKREGCQVRVIPFPDNMDPDEFIQKKGRQAFEDNIASALSLIDYKLKMLRNRFDLSLQEERTSYAIECAKILTEIESPIEREAYIKKIQSDTGFSYEVLHAQVEKLAGVQRNAPVNRNRIGNNRYNKNEKPAKLSLFAHIRAEQNIICLMMKEQDKIESILSKIDWHVFSDPLHQKLVQRIEEEARQHKRMETAEILNYFDDDQSVNKIAEIFSLELEYDNIDKYIRDCIEEINRFQITNTIKNLQDELSQSYIDIERRKAITMEIQKLNLKYQSIKKESR